MGAMREAMLREMALRGLAPRTQRAYVGWMARLVSKTRVPADQLLESQVRTYLAGLAQGGLSASTMNQAISAVRLFFNGVLHRDWALDVFYQRAPQRVPVTMTPDEVGRLLRAVPGDRFLLHVLPRGFVRVRHYGFQANGCRRQLIARARQLLADPGPPVPQPIRESWQDLFRRLTGRDPLRCPSCKEGVLRIVSAWIAPDLRPRGP